MSENAIGLANGGGKPESTAPKPKRERKANLGHAPGAAFLLSGASKWRHGPVTSLPAGSCPKSTRATLHTVSVAATPNLRFFRVARALNSRHACPGDSILIYGRRPRSCSSNKLPAAS
jgi:hypothetical protein